MPTPSKLTPKVRRNLISAREQGHPWRLAARLAGVSPRTVLRWRQDHADLADELAEAHARFLDRHLRIIGEAAETDWRASQFLLRVRAPKVFGEAREKPEITRDTVLVFAGFGIPDQPKASKPTLDVGGAGARPGAA